MGRGGARYLGILSCYPQVKYNYIGRGSHGTPGPGSSAARNQAVVPYWQGSCGDYWLPANNPEIGTEIWSAVPVILMSPPTGFSARQNPHTCRGRY